MGKFTAVPGLDELVARMVAPDVRDIAEQVHRTAVELAPAAKKWVSMSDNLVRDTHREAHEHPSLPANLRFEVRGQPWDIEHGLSPGVDYLLHPKDTTRLPIDSVQHVNCRCHAALEPTAIAEAIHTGPTEILGPLVRVVVSCEFYQIVQCEFGDAYPDGTTAPGTRFMGRAAARVAGKGGYGPGGVAAPGGNYSQKPGQGGDVQQ